MPYRHTTARAAAGEAKRVSLLDAALALLAGGGFRAVTIKSVAALAGVSTGSVYCYFHDKQALLDAAFRTAADIELRVVQAACLPAAGDAPGTRTAYRLGRAVDTFARRAMCGRTLAWALLLEPVDPAVEAARLEYRHAYADVFAEVVQDGVASGELPEQDVALTAAALVGAVGEALTGPLSPLGSGAAHDGAAATSTERDGVVAAILRCCLGVVNPPSLPPGLGLPLSPAPARRLVRRAVHPHVPASKETS